MVIVQPIWNVEGEMDWERSNDLILAGRELIKGKREKVRFEAKISLDEGILDLVQWYNGRENYS